MSITQKNFYASHPTTERGRRTLLTSDKNNTKFLYGCNNIVYIRDLADPLNIDTYQEHTANVTAAAYSPSGYYIASGDDTGKIRIWATNNVDKTLKLEIQPLSGPVRDISWSEDSQRLVVVGEGKDRFAHCFLWDSGSTIGEISGHSKGINACDFRKARPFRVVTGSEDCQINFYPGPPFKFSHSNKSHTRFVNAVRFSPDGTYFVSVGSDGKIFLFDGKSGELIREISHADGHSSAIYSVSWSPDGKQFITSSADRTVKLWDVETNAVVKTFTFTSANEVEYMQVSTLWAGSHILSLGLNGDLNYLDIENPSKPKRVIQGHNKSITNVVYNPDNNTLYAGDVSGVITSWEEGVGSVGRIHGKGHTSGINSMALIPGEGKLVTCSIDDTVRVSTLSPFEYTSSSISITATPNDLAVGKQDTSLMVVVSTRAVFVVRGGAIVSTLNVNYTPQTVDISPDDSEVVVGGKDKMVYVYSLSGNNLTQAAVLAQHRGGIIRARYSPDGQAIAVGDSNREIIVWDRASRQAKYTNLVYHTSRVSSLAWSADSALLVSGSLDTNIIIWNLAAGTRIIHKTAHPGGVNAVCVINANTIASAGSDNSIKTWTFSF